MMSNDELEELKKQAEFLFGGETNEYSIRILEALIKEKALEDASIRLKTSIDDFKSIFAIKRFH